MAQHHHIKALGKTTERADTDRPWPTQLRLVMRPGTDSVDIAKTIHLKRGEDSKIEKVDFPVDRIDHQRKVDHCFAASNIFIISSRADHRIISIYHAAGAGYPPQARRMHAARKVAGANLYIGIGTDNGLFSILQITGDLD